MEVQDDIIRGRLLQKDEAAFEQVFTTHFKNLHAYACTLLQNEAEAEETVQQVFFKLWERMDRLHIEGSLAAYLYRAVYNESINHLRHRKVRQEHRLHVAYSSRQDQEQPGNQLRNKELEERLHKALNTLPEQCRTIFQMSRFENLKYREIATRLEISVKTVENQMGKALRLLRNELADLLALLLILLFY